MANKGQKTKPIDPAPVRDRRGPAFNHTMPGKLLEHVKRLGSIERALKKMSVARLVNLAWTEKYPEWALAIQEADSMAHAWMKEKALQRCEGKNKNGSDLMIRFMLQAKHGYVVKSAADIDVKQYTTLGINWGAGAGDTEGEDAAAEGNQ